MTDRLLPTRSLASHPHLDQLKRQAKELLDAFRSGDGAASDEVHRHFRRADAQRFALHDAQLVLARAYGFDSWPRLKAFVDGATVRRLVESIQAGDVDAVRSMVAARPELVRLDVAEDDEHQALHHAVLARQPEMVRFLMQHGADARKGIWPHRGATTALTLAAERGYDDIARIIEDEEQRRPVHRVAALAPSEAPDDLELWKAISAGDEAALRKRHREGQVSDGHRLLSHAVASNRLDMLGPLLDLGLDPNETERLEGVDEVVSTWGAPLRACAIQGRVDMVRLLLACGAKANTNVYAATSALYEAYRRKNAEMIALLERHGARLTPIAVGELGLIDRAVEWLARNAHGAEPLEDSGHGVADDLLSAAIGSPSPEIVTLALQAIDWPRDDSRWHRILENGLYRDANSDRPRHLEAFRCVLDRCDPNVRSKRGATLLHDVAASRGRLNPGDRVVYAKLLLNRGARLDIRDDLLQSTPLGWACRWGRLELVTLLLERGADPVEAGAAPWATPMAWALKMGHQEIAEMLQPTSHH